MVTPLRLKEAVRPATDVKPAADALPDRLMSIVRELTEIVVAENRLMAQGFPADIALSLDRKILLSHDYKTLWKNVVSSGTDQLAENAKTLGELAAATEALKTASAENLCRLEAAISASMRRVEAVMLALKDHQRDGSAYGANGSVPSALRLPPIGSNFQA